MQRRFLVDAILLTGCGEKKDNAVILGVTAGSSEQIAGAHRGPHRRAAHPGVGRRKRCRKLVRRYGGCRCGTRTQHCRSDVAALRVPERHPFKLPLLRRRHRDAFNLHRRAAHITAPDRPGTGFEPAWDVIEKHTVERWEFTRRAV